MAALGVFAGGLITLIVARVYYEKASVELNKEAEYLRKLNILMLRAMQNAGLADLNTDENGNPIGLNITVVVSEACGVSEVKAHANVDTVKTES